MHLRVELWRPAALASLIAIASLAAHAGIIDDVRVQVGQSNFSAAESELREYRTRHGVTPEYVEAYSWVARAAVEPGG